MAKKNESNVLTVLVTLTLVLTIVNLIGLFGVYGSLVSFSLSGNAVANQPTAPTQPTPEPSQPSPTAVINAADLVDNDPFLGDSNAPLVIVEWSDFQCPFCARFHKQTFPQIKSEYIDTGKVKFVYRDFPLGFHPNAEPAALAAECANEQNKFWEFHDKIFENQVSLSTDLYKRLAVELGLNTVQFNTCFDSAKYRSEVQKDLADGSAIGIRGTPGFIVGNIPLSGAQPFSVFQQTIESQL